jgi:hypothetical protein
MLLHFWKSEIHSGFLWTENKGVDKAALSPEALGKNPFPCLFQVQEAPSSIFKTKSVASSNISVSVLLVLMQLY